MLLWLALGLGALLLVWLRGVKRARERWLEALNLVGKWELEAAGVESAPRHRALTLSGDLAAGRHVSAGKYLARDEDAVQRGEWRLSGRTLILSPTEGDAPPSGPARYELRLFEAGRIGLDGPGREREVYVKRDGNVIPLLLRPKRGS